MLDHLPKNGLIPKGRYLSLRFFQDQIAKNIEDVRLRIRDHIAIESKKKGRRQELLTEDQYLELYFKAHSMDFQSDSELKGHKENIMAEEADTLINKQFVQNYQLFYEPKWKIWLQGTPDLETLAVLNHLAFGYFYEVNQKAELRPLFKCLAEEGMSSWKLLLRSGIEVTMGTLKRLRRNQNSNEVYYTDYIRYFQHERKQNEKASRDPRMSFDPQQLVKRHKKAKNKVMTLKDLRSRLEMSPQPYDCAEYETRVVNNHAAEEFIFEFERYRWSENTCISEDIQKQTKKFSTDLQEQKIDEFLKSNIITFQRSAKLVKFLQTIPNFKYDLSNQERQVISTKGSLIVIGRSGTGKTTCALLRLFSLQTLFKVKQVSIERQFTSDDVQSASMMRNIFLTASPLLINWLKKSYVQHLVQVKYELKNKEINSKNLSQKAKQINAKMQKQSLMQELRLEQQKLMQMNARAKCLNFLTSEDYPGFFTIKNFLIMLDGIYNQNFFLRTENKSLYRGQIFLKDEMRIQQLYEQIYWIKRNGEKYRQSSQIDYEYFYNHFWKHEIPKLKELKHKHNPMVVWSQIFSTIQGSTLSHKCPNSYISEDTYIRISKNRFIGEQEKREIYAIFLRYSSWKSIIHKFDQTDLVNHLLRKIQRNSYLGPKINYLFIDEVQDLTPATIYLVSQTVSNNIFYTGDTAQSISKGVIFKFSDIKLLYKSDESTETIDKQEPEIMQLTVNFRSHNNILRVANCLIKVIEVLFPKAIDKLRKERSRKNGPKPVVVDTPAEIQEIFQYRKNKQKIRLSSRQAIIVRRQENKEEVKKIFPGAILLTIAQCKGLQYEDIILWKIFEEDTYQTLWKVIDFLMIKRQVQEKEEKIEVEQGSRYDQIEDILCASPKLKQININGFYQICSELKLLYTAVTRARQVLIFYKSVPSKILKIFDQLGLVDRFSKQFVEEVGAYKAKNEETEQQTNGQIQEMEMEKEEWKRSGLQFYKKQNYEQAWVCFKNIKESKMCRLIEAKIKMKQAKKVEEDIKIRKILAGQVQAKDLQTKKRDALKQAAQAYWDIQRWEQAGKLFFQVSEYGKALKCFSKLDMYFEMGRCNEELKRYIQASKLFQKCRKYEQMLRCLIKSQKHLLTMIKIAKYAEHLKHVTGLDKTKQITKNEIVKQINDKVVQDYEQNQQKILHYTSPDKQYHNNCCFMNIEADEFQKDEVIYKQKVESEVKQPRKKNKYKKKKQRTFYFDSDNEYEQQKEKMEEKKKEKKEEKVVKVERKGRVLKTVIKLMQKLPIDELRIAYMFEDSQNKILKSLNGYLSTPFITKQLIKKLQDLGLFQLCLILADVYHEYESFADYYAALLYAKHPRSEDFIEQRSQVQINKYLGLLSFQDLHEIQSTIKPCIVNSLTTDLVICGFYRDCEIFFKSKKQYYHNFLVVDKYLQTISKKFYNYDMPYPLSFMGVNNWPQTLSEREVIFSLKQLLKLKIQKQWQVQRLMYNLYGQLNRIRFKLSKLDEQKYHSECQYDKLTAAWAREQREEKQYLQDLIEEQKQLDIQNKNIYENIKDEDQAQYLKSIANNEKPVQQMNKKWGQEFRIAKKDIQANDKRLQQNTETQKRVRERIKQIGKEIKQQMRKYNYNYEANERKYYRKQDQLQQINYLISQFQFGIGNYPPIFKQHLVWKDLVSEMENIYYFNHISLERFSHFLNLIYANSKLHQAQLFTLLNFSIKQQNYVRICEIITLAISILLRHRKIISQISYFTENYKTKHVIVEGLRNFFSNIILILQDQNKNPKFFSIFLDFLEIRLFKNIKGFSILNGYALMSASMANLLQFISSQDLIESWTYFDQNKSLLFAKQQQAVKSAIKYLKRKYWEYFRENLNTQRSYMQKQKKYVQKKQDLNSKNENKQKVIGQQESDVEVLLQQPKDLIIAQQSNELKSEVQSITSQPKLQAIAQQYRVQSIDQQSQVQSIVQKPKVQSTNSQFTDKAIAQQSKVQAIIQQAEELKSKVQSIDQHSQVQSFAQQPRDLTIAQKSKQLKSERQAIAQATTSVKPSRPKNLKQIQQNLKIKQIKQQQKSILILDKEQEFKQEEDQKLQQVELDKQDASSDQQQGSNSQNKQSNEDDIDDENKNEIEQVQIQEHTNNTFQIIEMAQKLNSEKNEELFQKVSMQLHENLMKVQKKINEQEENRIELIKILYFRNTIRKIKSESLRKHLKNNSNCKTLMFYILRAFKEYQYNSTKLKIEKQLIQKEIAILQTKKQNDLQKLQILQKERQAIIQKFKLEELQIDMHSKIIQGQPQQGNTNLISWCQHCNQKQVQTPAADFRINKQLDPFCENCVTYFDNRQEIRDDVYLKI